MESWESIRRIGVDVRSIRADGRAEVDVRLSAVPPPEWQRNFMARYTAGNVRSPDDDWPLPEIQGVSIRIWPLEADLTGSILVMDERIEQTNADYQSQIVPEKQRQADAVAEAQRQYDERLERLRRQAEEL